MTNENTKNRFAEILKAAQQTQIVKSTIQAAPEKKEETKQPENKEEKQPPELSTLTISDILDEKTAVENVEYCTPIALNIPVKTTDKAELKASNIYFVEYNEKSFAIFGETKQVKEKLKMLGGRFNPFLNYNGGKMAGWIFSKRNETAVKKSLNIN